MTAKQVFYRIKGVLHVDMLRIYPAELSCVGGAYASVGCRDPVYNSAAIGYGCRIVNWVTVI